MSKKTNQSPEICPVCGSRLPEKATKCLVCGTDFSTKSSKKDSETPIVQGSRMPEITLSLPVALGLLALFLTIGAVIVFMLVRQQPEIAIPPTVTPTSTVTVTPTATSTPETPTPTSTPEPSPTPFTYTVVERDSCISIAFAFNVSVQSIVLLNGLPAACDRLVVGQQLLIPHPTPTPTPQPTATLGADEATRAACLTIPYTIQANDTLSRIAANYSIPIEVIKSWNGLVSDIVREGQNITLPLCEQVSFRETATPTPAPPYPAPNLLLPADGAVFASDAIITLQWASVGALRNNEAYMVTLENITEGEGRKLISYVTDTKLNVPASFQPTANSPHIIRWWVQSVRRAGLGDDGQPAYEPAGAASTYRSFVWSGTSRTP